MQDLLKKLLFGNAGGSNGGAPSLNLSFVDGGTFDPRITFSRGTNATLTGSNGLIQYAPHNLLTNSEDFEAAAWAKTDLNTTGTPTWVNVTTAPDGTSTADKLIANNVNGKHVLFRIQGTTALTTHTMSIFAKASEYGFLALSFIQSSNSDGALYVFNLADGTYAQRSLSGTFVNVSASSQSFGNGWWRCSITFTNAVGGIADYFIAAPSPSSNPTVDLVYRTASYTGDNTSGIFSWGAQLNVGALQTYNSTTPKNLLGFTQEPENAAWTKSNSYVQQNLLTFSEDITNAAWLMLGSAGASRLADVTLAPNGSLTADSYSVGTGSGSWYIANYANTSIVSGQSYTFSVYLKANGCNFAFIRPHNNSANFGASGFIVSLVDGTITYPSSPTAPASTGTATAVGNGWWRVTATSTANLTTATTGGPGVWPCQTNAFAGTNGVAPANFTGNGTDGVFIWGAQLVQGADAGQYTQTTSAAAVTRYTNWDGTLTGRKLVEDTAAASIHLLLTTTDTTVINGTRYTSSLYAKAAERSWIQLAEGTGTTAGAYFNLTTGVVGTVSGTGSPTASIQSVGGGWYRCTLSWNAIGVAARLRAYMATGDGTASYTGDGTSGIYVSDFQLSNSASVDPYVYNPQAAAASAAFYGPRIDYNPVTLASNGLLIEEQRTNLLTYSEDFTNAAWTKIQTSITANTTVAPDGNTTADALIEAATNAQHQMLQAATLTAAAYTWTVFAKATSGSQRWLNLYPQGTGVAAAAVFDINTGTVTLTSGPQYLGSSIVNVGNGWFRCSLTFTGAAVSVNNVIYLSNNATIAAPGYTGDGTSGIFLWGSQVELGAFATSYIPTVASQVTRNADSASMLGDNFYTWYNQNQGTVRVEGDTVGYALNQMIVSLTDGTLTNPIQIYNDVSGQIQANVWVGGTVFVPYVQNSVYKYALGVETNNVAASINGASVVSDLSVGPLVAYNRLNIGSRNGSLPLNGHIRSIRYYTVRLPDATLQQITS